MSVFTVYQHPGGAPDRAVFVKDGFTGFAMVFTVLWALWHRMWIVAAVLLALFAAVALAVGFLGLDPGLAAVIELGISLLFGFEAQNLRALSLQRAGYREAGLVGAENLDVAELKYVMDARTTHASPVPAVSTTMQPPADTLGLFGNV